jgi:hypothetical protein
LGPDAWQNDLSPTYYTELLNASSGSMHAITVHDYADDCCVPALGNVLNLTCLDAFFDNAAFVRDIASAFGVATWNGEGALHAYSGVAGLTNTMVSSVFYMHALGSYAESGIGLFSRQSMIGGDYELINRTTFLPTPDYFALLLFRQLVGGTALDSAVASDAAGVRAHAFCAHDVPGGVVALLLNFAASGGVMASLAWPSPPPAGAQGELYTLTGVAGWSDADESPSSDLSDGTASSNLFRAALNNATLVFAGELPTLAPVSAALGEPVWLPATSATFVLWRGAGVAACA